MAELFALVYEGLLTNLPSQLVGGILATGIGCAWRRRTQRPGVRSSARRAGTEGRADRAGETGDRD
ncbi:hypothetical protein [Streptomyces sp. NPDC014894]|uniref:hypothetical protein n=1 Tax=Streptomyces sp. NPDC014894 TaxID=3364931 RepID=UPI0036FC2704